MGIPKYFKWITNKYNDLILENVEKIDNLFLDTNCLIHPCCRKIIKENKHLIVKHYNDYENNINNIQNDLNMYSKLEKLMFEDITDYITNLLEFSKPKKLLYISIDGVAPRAKMEQQRLRRYRSYKEKSLIDDIYKKHHNEIEPYWDTNAITPGTTFMLKLSNYLQNNVLKISKLNNDITIILSDSSVPGEGEHKIVEHIRLNTNKEDICCIYGLDADLIMLSLCLDNKIYLLRESVNFGKVNMDVLLYLSINEFKLNLKNEIIKKIDKDIDFEINDKVIIDYVVLCFLLGNDFLPKLINLDINENSIEDLLTIYTKLISIRKHNLVVKGIIQYNFLQQILNHLYNLEDTTLQELQRKINNRKVYRKNNYTNDVERDIDMLKYYPIMKQNNPFKLGEIGWRNKYYQYYFNIDNIIKNKDYINELCYIYIEGLQWNIEYYLNGCCSWEWYYPYRVSPCLREICQYLNNRIYQTQFNLSQPYTPLQQLIIVLPRASKHLLPTKYQLLLDDKELVQYYPNDFILDIFNHVWFHECNPIIPIIHDKHIFDKMLNLNLENIDILKNKNNSKPIYIYQRKKNNNINLIIE